MARYSTERKQAILKKLLLSEEAREWVLRFVRFYNQEHRHSKIDYVTPEQRHNGEHIEILANRKAVLKAHKAKHPARWSSMTRQCEPVPTYSGIESGENAEGSVGIVVSFRALWVDFSIAL